MSEHLGGFTPGGDEATWFPELWTWLVQSRGVRSVIDMGCGEGHSLKFLRELGCTVHGIEGTAQEDPDIDQHDYTHGPWVNGPDVDLLWTCEFVEHVDEASAHHMVSTFRKAQTVLMTHAFPGQGGHHHVNCRDREYWVGFMAAAGFTLDTQLTAITQGFSRYNTSPWNHYLRSGMAFVRSTDAFPTVNDRRQE